MFDRKKSIQHIFFFINFQNLVACALDTCGISMETMNNVDVFVEYILPLIFLVRHLIQYAVIIVQPYVICSTFNIPK